MKKKNVVHTDVKDIYTYDFSGEMAEEEYCRIENGIEKYFAYMAMMLKQYFEEEETYDLFKEAYQRIQCISSQYGCVIDADSYSEILQDIYKKLWDVEKISNLIRKDGKIQGETLNSAATTINKYYEFIEKKLDEDKEERDTERLKRELMRTKKGKPQPVSKKFILSKYLVERNSSIIQQLLQSEKLEKFLKVYHTLGNFMPVAAGCNGPRGIGKLQDYWDLTLFHIYRYYKWKNQSMEDEMNKEIEIIIKEQDKIKDYREWLDSFKHWHQFVECNYLYAFVCAKEEDYYPIELWEGHFSQKEVYPQSIKQCEAYFETAANCIYERTCDLAVGLDIKNM